MNSLFQDIKTFITTIKQLLSLLTVKQRRQAVGVFILVVIGAAFETLGVAAVLPFVYAVIDTSQLWNNKYIMVVADMLQINTDTELIVGLGCCGNVLKLKV